MFSWGLGVDSPVGPHSHHPDVLAFICILPQEEGGEDGGEASLHPPGVGGPLRKSAQSPGHRGPWRTLCEPSRAARALDMPSLGCCLEFGIGG